MRSQSNLRYFTVAAGAALLLPVAANGGPQTPPSAPVTVVNTTANPVPVTGSIAVTGTSNVNVTNTSIPVTGTVNASQSGAWNVGITGTPTVNVSNDSSLQTPYYSRRPGLACGSDEAGACVVPAGKRLVIEHISGEFVASVSPSNSCVFLVVDPLAGLNSYTDVHTFIGLPITGGPPPGSGLFGFSHPFKLILNSGAKFYLYAPGDAFVAVTGYLIAQP